MIPERIKLALRKRIWPPSHNFTLLPDSASFSSLLAWPLLLFLLAVNSSFFFPHRISILQLREASSADSSYTMKAAQEYSTAESTAVMKASGAGFQDSCWWEDGEHGMSAGPE